MRACPASSRPRQRSRICAGWSRSEPHAAARRGRAGHDAVRSRSGAAVAAAAAAATVVLLALLRAAALPAAAAAAPLSVDEVARGIFVHQGVHQEDFTPENE